MGPPRHIRVFPQDIKPGAKYKGYVCGNSTHFCEVTITEDGTPLIFDKHPIKEKVDYFQRDLTWEEERDWYKNNIDMTNSRNQLNLMGLHNQMYSVGDAYHEMWNGWIEYNWVRQLMEIVDEDFFIIGIAPPPWGCHAIDDPVAIVAEYDETGERFWCHAHKHLVEKMIDDIQDMLFLKKGVNWSEDYATVFKRGSCCIKVPAMEAFSVDKNGNVVEKEIIRSHWKIDTEIPIFTQDRDYINSLVGYKEN